MSLEMLQCYNRGCGKKFNPSDNKDGDCAHHPGIPIFHDAYKGWSCCNKKCIDFTEFLNIKGCTKSRHSHKKPPEPEKPFVDKDKIDQVTEIVTKSLNKDVSLERPPFDTPQVTLSPLISPSLLEQIKGLTTLKVNKSAENELQIGQNCTNNSCKETYKETTDLYDDKDTCLYHPGVPIFHEGMKYWSCCKKKTTEFSVFLEQRGCKQGKHAWFPKDMAKKVQCRMDWHQTGTYVFVSIYAKKYLPSRSIIKLNPIRLTIDLFFIEESTRYNLDIELRGIVDIKQSSVNMLPTKVEIKLKKAECGSWSILDIAREPKLQTSESKQNIISLKSQSEAVNLSDL